MEIETSDAGRRAHYAQFYAEQPPIGCAVVLGNCQAESLRITMTADDLVTVRIPPVHELTTEDLPFLERVLGAASVVVTQPIRDGYRELPVGTRELSARLRASTALVVVPAIRHRSLHPMHAVVRIPDVDVDDPPLVAYHDLRVLAEALGAPLPPLTPRRVRRIADESTATLQAREVRAGAIPVSDVFARPRADLLRTFNHPGNPVFAELAARVRQRLGLSTGIPPVGRPLLAAVVAPVEPVVVETWALETPADAYWTVEGSRIHSEVVAEAHRRWYEQHPRQLELAGARLADELRSLQDA